MNIYNRKEDLSWHWCFCEFFFLMFNAGVTIAKNVDKDQTLPPSTTPNQMSAWYLSLNALINGLLFSCKFLHGTKSVLIMECDMCRAWGFKLKCMHSHATEKCYRNSQMLIKNEDVTSPWHQFLLLEFKSFILIFETLARCRMTKMLCFMKQYSFCYDLIAITTARH